MNLTSPPTRETVETPPPAQASNIALPLLLVLAAYPTWQAITTAPAMLAAPVAVCAYWLLLRRKLYVVAGLLTALCAFKPEWLPFLALPGFVFGGLQFAGGVAVAALATFFGAQAMHYPLSISMLAGVGGDIPPHAMQNFSAMLSLILGENTPNLQIGTLACYAVSVISSSELWWRIHHIPDSHPKFLKKCAATTLIMLTTSMHTSAVDYIVLVPVLVWLWQATADDVNDNGGLVRKVIMAYPLVTWAHFGLQAALPAVSVPIYFAWAVVLSVCLLTTLDVETNRILNARFKAQNPG
ncbi:MAG TPA: hypothetical protein V6C89_20515 [Drouetiella sp.]|jgi:hypothetical protein